MIFFTSDTHFGHANKAILMLGGIAYERFKRK